MIDGLEIRKEILGNAVTLENTVSIFLAALLGINDAKNSITLGNKGSSLSFNNKIDLLIDIGALDGDTKSKYQTFMEVRNQFMHNLYAKDYVSCYSFLPKGKDSFILKKYPQQNSKSEEDQLKDATLQLTEDVLIITSKLIHKLEEKLLTQAKAEVYEQSNNVIIESMSNAVKEFNETIKKEENQTKNYSGNELQQIVWDIFQTIVKKWQDSMRPKE